MTILQGGMLSKQNTLNSSEALITGLEIRPESTRPPRVKSREEHIDEGLFRFARNIL